MKSASIHSLRNELKSYTKEELMEHCLRLAKYKKENKELLTYLLFEAQDEEAYIKGIVEEMDQQMSSLKPYATYARNKGMRKLLREVKKFIRYSGKKETEVVLLMEFCTHLNKYFARSLHDPVLRNLLERQRILASKKLSYLHEDLQFDFLEIYPDLHLEGGE
jgi:uncharacterized protein (DUF1501 family)